MAYEKVQISTWSNNQYLLDVLYTENYSEIEFVKFKEGNLKDYVCLFIDLDQDTVLITQKVLNFYLESAKSSSKIAIILLPSLSGSSEKISIFRKLFDEISKKTPIHRTVICRNLYLFANSTPSTSFESYLLNIITKNESKVSKKGNIYYYPISIQNLVELIKKSLYLSNTNGKEFFLEGEKISDLNLSYLLKKYIQEYLGQNLDINTSEDSLDNKDLFESSAIATLATLNLKQTSNFETDLKKYISTISVEKNTITSMASSHNAKNLFSQIKNKFHKHKEITENLNIYLKAKTLKFFEKSLAIISIIYLITSITFIASAYYSLVMLEKSLFFLRKGDIANTSKNLNNSIVLHNISQTNYYIVSPLINFFSSEFNDLNSNFFNFVNYTQTTILSLSQTYKLSESIYNSLSKSTNNYDYKKSTLALKSNLQQSYESINQLEILLNGGQLPEPVIQKIKQAIEYKQLKKSQEQIGELIKITDLLPVVLGSGKAGNIFLIIQNDNEIRSTGGVIEFIYQLNIENGKIIFEKIYQPQEIDNLSDFSIISPPLVEKVTGEEKWKLRDMNYNPDFPQTATNISWYLEKKLKIKPDILVSINTSVFEDVLAKKTTLSENLTSLSSEEYTSKLHEGSAGLATLEIAKNITKKVFNQQASLLDLGEIATKVIFDGSANFWSSDVAIEDIIKNQPFSGSIKEYQCISSMSSSRECISQTLHLNFSNYSQIPLNQYLKKTLVHKVTPLTLSVDHEIVIDYGYSKNTPITNRNLAEIVQLYIPKSSVLGEISINNTVYPDQKIIVSEDGGLARYQFIISTTLNEKQQLRIKYSSPQSHRTILPIAYSFTDIGQSGGKFQESSLEINIPDLARPAAITSEVVSKPGKIVYKNNQKVSTFGVNFIPK